MVSCMAFRITNVNALYTHGLFAWFPFMPWVLGNYSTTFGHGPAPSCFKNTSLSNSTFAASLIMLQTMTFLTNGPRCSCQVHYPLVVSRSGWAWGYSKKWKYQPMPVPLVQNKHDPDQFINTTLNPVGQWNLKASYQIQPGNGKPLDSVGKSMTKR